jgi:hypothetical protein
MRAGFFPNQLTVWHAGPCEPETVVGVVVLGFISVGEPWMMQGLRDPWPESQERFGYERLASLLAATCSEQRQYRWWVSVSARLPLVSLPKCSWAALPSPTARLFRSASESEVISELTTATGSVDLFLKGKGKRIVFQYIR